MEYEVATNLKSGKVRTIKGDVVEVEFLDEKPLQHELLIFEENPQTKLEVYYVGLDNRAICLCLEGVENLYRGVKSHSRR